MSTQWDYLGREVHEGVIKKFYECSTCHRLRAEEL